LQLCITTVTPIASFIAEASLLL